MAGCWTLSVRRGHSLDKLRFCSDAEVALDGGPAVTAEDRYRREMRWMIATKTAAPMIDHRIGKDCPLT